MFPGKLANKTNEELMEISVSHKSLLMRRAAKKILETNDKSIVKENATRN